MSDKPNIINAIFNSDDYKRGQDDGYKDGLAGKDRSFYKMPLSLKAAIHGNAAMDSYASGYRHGYTLGASFRLCGAKKPHGVEQSTTLQGGIAMPGYHGIDGQIDLLDNMRNTLVQLSSQLEELIRVQDIYLRELESEGLDMPTWNRLEEFQRYKTEELKKLIQSIEDQELPYVERIIHHLQSTPR